MIIDSYNALITKQSDETIRTMIKCDIKYLNIVKKIYQALKVVENKTVKIYFKEENNPTTVDVKYLLNNLDEPDRQFYLNRDFKSFSDILKITSGKKTIYQKEISNE